MTATIIDSSSRARRSKPSARSVGERIAGEIRDVFARPRPGQGDRPATAAPFPDVPAAQRDWVVAAFLLGVIARDTLGDPAAAGHALPRALDLAPPSGKPGHHLEALSRSEIRVLRYLQTNLSAREIAAELYVSANTVKTHQRHLYAKLGVRSRSQAVEQARAFGLLAQSAPPDDSDRVAFAHPGLPLLLLAQVARVAARSRASDRRNHSNRGMPAHPPRPDAGRYGGPSAPPGPDRAVQH
jgi:DNA-binding CsgD family transcriptional regulator